MINLICLQAWSRLRIPSSPLRTYQSSFATLLLLVCRSQHSSTFVEFQDLAFSSLAEFPDLEKKSKIIRLKARSQDPIRVTQIRSCDTA